LDRHEVSGQRTAEEKIVKISLVPDGTFRSGEGGERDDALFLKEDQRIYEGCRGEEEEVSSSCMAEEGLHVHELWYEGVEY